jgi:hypothetical protein
MTEPPPKPQISIEKFRPLEKGTLRGFVDVKFPMGLTVRDISVHTKDGRSWVGLPVKPQVTQDGRVRKGDDGKIMYSSIMEFETKEIANRFSAKVIALLADFNSQKARQ